MTTWQILLIASFFGLFVTCLILARGGQEEPFLDALVSDDEDDEDEGLLYDRDGWVAGPGRRA